MIKNISLLAAMLLSYNISAMLFTPMKQATKCLPSVAQNIARHTHIVTPANTLANHVTRYIDLQREQQRLQKELSTARAERNVFISTMLCSGGYCGTLLLLDLLTSFPSLTPWIVAQTVTLNGCLYFNCNPLSSTEMRDLERSCDMATAEMNTFKQEALNPFVQGLKIPGQQDLYLQELLRVAEKVVE